MASTRLEMLLEAGSVISVIGFGKLRVVPRVSDLREGFKYFVSVAVLVYFKFSGAVQEGEVHAVAFVFFVVQHEFVQFFGFGHGGVWGVFAVDEAADGFVVFGVEPEFADGEVEFGYHAVGYGVSVVYFKVFFDGDAFDGVCDRVSEVERFAQPFFAGVALYDEVFDVNGFFDQLEEFFPSDVREVGAHDFGEVFFIGEECVFEHFSESGQDLPLGEGGEEAVVDEDAFGLVECTDFVFEPVEVDACLTTDGGVYLREQGGGDVDAGDAPFEAGGGEPADVCDHPSPDVD